MPRSIEILNINNLNLADTSWQDQGACRNYPADWWFISSTKAPKGNTSPGARARNICNTQCKVKDICLQWILEIEASTGNISADIYAGTAPSERGTLRLCAVPSCRKPVASRKDKQRADGKAYAGRCCSPECDKIRDRNQHSHKPAMHNDNGEMNVVGTFYKQGRIA